MAAKIDKIKDAKKKGRNYVRVATDILIEDYKVMLQTINKYGYRNETTYLNIAIKKLNQDQ